jgi:hypothetical protein
MKNEHKTAITANAQESNQQGVKKTRLSKRAGWLLPALLAAAFTPLVISCPTEVETKEVEVIKEVEKEVPGPEVQVPTYPEITIPVRLFGETMNVVCPGNLMGESYTKINSAMIEIEGAIPEGSVHRNNVTNLLANKTVAIEVKKDGYPSAIEAENSYTIYVDYNRVENSDTIIGINKMLDEIFNALLMLNNRYESETL